MRPAFYLFLLFLLCDTSVHSQITFQKIFGAGTYCPYGTATADGNYICTVDSGSTRNYKYNGYGTPVWNRSIPLGHILPSSITDDGNGFIFCGTRLDSTGIANGFIARLDANGDTVNYKMFPPVNDGNYGRIALPTLDGDYVFDVYEEGPGISSTSTLYKLDIGFNTLWNVPSGASGISNSGIVQDKDSNFIFTDFDQLNLSSIIIEKYSNAGVPVISKTYSDTVCNCFSSFCISTTRVSDIIVGTEFQQKTLLMRLDDNFDTMWTKLLNWSNNTPVSIARDRNDGFYALLNYQGTATMYHFDANGDSVAVYQFNPMIFTSASRMQRCPDGGFLISGTTYDYFNVPHGLLLKTDSLCRFTPQGYINASGPLTFCNGDSLVLTGPSGNYSYLWSSGDTTQTLVVTATGTYYLTITAANGNTATLVPANVFVSNPLTPQITNFIDYLQASGSGTFQWYLNGVPLQHANHDTLHTTATGNFTVVVTDTVGCVRVSPQYFYSWTGVQNVASDGLKIFPNPATNEITIAGNFNNETVLVMDSHNRLLKELKGVNSKSFTIDLSDLKSGIYFLQFPNENRVLRFSVLH